MIKLRQMRRQARKTQEQLAKESGMSIDSIRRYERGERAPRADDIKKLSKIFGCTPNELLEEDEEHAR